MEQLEISNFNNISLQLINQSSQSNMQKSITFLIGIPGSGKTTLAKTIKKYKIKGYKIISADEIRFRLFNYSKTGIDYEFEFEPTVFQIYKNQIWRCLNDPNITHCILDEGTLNMQPRYQNELLKIAHEKQAIIQAIILHVSLKNAIMRNYNRNRTVPPNEMKRMCDEFRSFDKSKMHKVIEINT
jgi:predicted kinase